MLWKLWGGQRLSPLLVARRCVSWALYGGRRTPFYLYNIQVTIEMHQGEMRRDTLFQKPLL